MSFSIRRILVSISSVPSDMISGGISSQFSSGGWSGVTSIAAASWVAGAGGVVSGCFSGFAGGSEGGPDGAEDMSSSSSMSKETTRHFKRVWSRDSLDGQQRPSAKCR